MYIIIINNTIATNPVYYLIYKCNKFDYMSDFKDFHKVKNMLFNVSKLKKGLEEVLKIKNYGKRNI